MIEGLITLLVVIVVVGIVAWVIIYILDKFPLPEPFHQVARVLVLLIALLVVLSQALPLLGVSLR